MSILIPGMEMPTSCWLCHFQDCGNCVLNNHKVVDNCIIEDRRDEDCPLVHVPEHGRLGDLDKLENGLRYMAKYQHGERQQGILGCCETIRLAPTIIPADKEGEG